MDDGQDLFDLLFNQPSRNFVNKKNRWIRGKGLGQFQSLSI